MTISSSNKLAVLVVVLAVLWAATRLAEKIRDTYFHAGVRVEQLTR
jgi:hypothetical protein